MNKQMQLIRKLKNRNNASVLQAVKELRDGGWVETDNLLSWIAEQKH
ncbi:MAG: hypothetical protein U9R58_10670 [Chloroflexota bacterium]|nr:hypothetical protein [Chloroflexota bacterium]